MKQLDKLKYDIANDYAKGKISDKQYENMKNEISILYQEIYKKRVDTSKNASNVNVNNELS